MENVNQKLSLLERRVISEKGTNGTGILVSSLGSTLVLSRLMALGGTHSGAATLPTLSETILIEQNAMLADYEVIRLMTLRTQLAQSIGLIEWSSKYCTCYILYVHKLQCISFTG